MSGSHSDVEAPARLLQLSQEDNVGVATAALEPGARVSALGTTIVVASGIPVGHKIAIRPIAAGEHVMKYGMPIGSATRAIAPGEHVHTHNLTSDYLPRCASHGDAHSTGAL
jgi:altronate dehydratase small subunit